MQNAGWGVGGVSGMLDDRSVKGNEASDGRNSQYLFKVQFDRGEFGSIKKGLSSKCTFLFQILTEDPQQICFHCFRQITTWASFRIMVQKKNIEFRRMQQASSLQCKLEDSVSVKGEPEEVVPADVSEGDRVMDPKDSDEENMLVKKEENSADQEDDSGMGSFEKDSNKEFDVKLEPSDEHEDTWSEVKVELNSSIDEFLCGFQLESEAEEEEDQLEIENPDEVAEPSMDWDVSDDEPLLNQDLVTTKEPTVDMTCGPSTSKAKKKLSKDGKIQCPICYQQDLPKQMYQHMKRRHVKDEVQFYSPQFPQERLKNDNLPVMCVLAEKMSAVCQGVPQRYLAHAPNPLHQLGV